VETGKWSREDATADASDRRDALIEKLGGRRANVPLRYWRQQAHFTTPVVGGRLARKAIEAGTAPMTGILKGFRLEPRDLANHIGVDEAAVEHLLSEPAAAPVVMLDGEDGVVVRPDPHDTRTVLVEAQWSGNGPGPLRFYRSPGLRTETAIHDLYELLWLVAELPSSPFPLDGIVFPKIEQPEEVDLINHVLDVAEGALDLPAGSIKVAFLVESGWGMAQLPLIARNAADRLCALIFGIADYSADLALPMIATDHPIGTWARAEIVNVAGAVGVPAIDSMTFDFPVRDGSLDDAANRTRFLDRMALVYRDAVQARARGMLGKLVGHPAQLFATLLAFENSFSAEAIGSEVRALEAYQSSVSLESRGVTIIDGFMSDQATDRHARALLRQATAMGRFDIKRALELRVIDDVEFVELGGIAESNREVPDGPE
jgi:citrate lyase beta subunit